MAKRQKYSDDYLVDEIKRFYEENGTVPRCVDFDGSKDYVSSKTIRKRFGTWNTAIAKAGLLPNTYTDIKPESVKSEAIRFYKDNHRSPYNYELSYSKGVIYNLFGNWNDFLRECNLPLNQRDRVEWDKEYGIGKIREFYNNYNRIPTATDLHKYGIHRHWLAGTFGSVRNALIESGLCTEKDLPTKEERLSNSLKYIRRFHKEYNRTPTVDEYNHEAKRNNQIIWSRNLVERLGKRFSEICINIIGDSISYDDSGIGRYSIDKNGELCRSYKEKMISNLLIDNNIKFKKEVKYTDINQDIKEGYVMDWYLVEYNVCVELFGMYQESAKRKDKIAYEYKVRTERKIDLCKEYDLNLISVFKRDKSEDIVSKFNEYGVGIQMTRDFVYL